MRDSELSQVGGREVASVARAVHIPTLVCFEVHAAAQCTVASLVGPCCCCVCANAGDNCSVQTGSDISLLLLLLVLLCRCVATRLSRLTLT
jgi:hypothetical protein